MQIRRRQDVNELDVLLISLMAWWGFWLVVPFSEVEQTRTYQLLFETAPRWAWALGMISVSVVKVWAILACRWWVRMAVFFLMNAWWVFVSAMVFVISPASPGWGMIGIVAIVSIWRNLQIAAMRPLVERSCDIDQGR